MVRPPKLKSLFFDPRDVIYILDLLTSFSQNFSQYITTLEIIVVFMKLRQLRTRQSLEKFRPERDYSVIDQ